MIEKIKKLLSPENRGKLLSLIYSVGAAAIFNMVIQIIIYPYIDKRLGADGYGVFLSVVSLLAIAAGTCGYAVNCARLLGVEKGRNANSDYNLILFVLGILGSAVGIFYLWRLGIATPISIALYVILNFATMLRYYSEVEFRISTNFFRYMIYYILISVGYIAGLFIFRQTGEWMTVLIAGELLAVFFVVVSGKIYRAPFIKPTQNFKPIVFSIGFVFLSVFIDNITLHADRILLLSIIGNGEAVSIFYVASLIGKIVAMLTQSINAILISYLVRYKGELSRKLWSIMVGAAIAFGILSFAGCLIVSPLIIRLLYPEYMDVVRPYLIPAILGQIFYFVSGMLMIVLLRFKGEKKQLAFNASYAVIFFVCVIVGTTWKQLDGFAYATLIANASRFVGAIIWGFISKKKKELVAQ